MLITWRERLLDLKKENYDRKPTDDLGDLDVNTAMWCILMSVTLQAAVHLGQDYLQNLRSIRINFRSLWINFFRTTENLIKKQTKTSGLSTIDWNQPMWRESSLLCDRAVQSMKSQTYVFADPVLCLGGISTVPVQAWKDKIKWYIETRCLKDLDRIDGEPMEFEWTFFAGFTTLGILAEIQNMSNFKEGSSSCPCTMIFFWRAPGNEENCVANSLNVATYAIRFPFGCWSHLGLGCEKQLYGTHVNKPNGEWNKTA